MNKKTRFNKDLFKSDGEYLNYVLDTTKNPWGEFVARFKYNRHDKTSFKKFLISNFTVEEYFSLLAKGHSPLDIVERKGWISARAKKALIEFGLPPTVEGKKEYARIVSANAY